MERAESGIQSRLRELRSSYMQSFPQSAGRMKLDLGHLPQFLQVFNGASIGRGGVVTQLRLERTVETRWSFCNRSAQSGRSRKFYYESLPVLANPALRAKCLRRRQGLPAGRENFHRVFMELSRG